MLELLVIIIPIIIIGYLDHKKTQKKREQGIIPSARKSNNLFDFMFYEINNLDK